MIWNVSLVKPRLLLSVIVSWRGHFLLRFKKKPLDNSFILRQILLTISVTPLCSPWTRMTPAHVINNFASVNLANLLILMSCVLKSLTTPLSSIFWNVKAFARPFRSLSFNSDLCGASELHFYFVLICGSGPKSYGKRGFFAGDSSVCTGGGVGTNLFAASLWDMTCSNRYLCVNCITPLEQ